MEVPLVHYGWNITLISYDGIHANVIDHNGERKRFWAQALRELGFGPGDSFDFGVYVKQFMNHVKAPAVRTAAKMLIEEVIRVRAYFKWERGDRQHGNDRMHWLQAEEEVLTLAKTLIDNSKPVDRNRIIETLLGSTLCDPEGIQAASKVFDEVEKEVIRRFEQGRGDKTLKVCGSEVHGHWKVTT